MQYFDIHSLDLNNYHNLLEYKEISYFGNVNLLNSKKLCVIGSRKASPYGKQVVKDVCENCTLNNIVTVSGFVDGVDIETFKQTLKFGGSTIACLGYGFDSFVKNDLKKLESFGVTNSNLSSVLFVSQFPNHQLGARWTFPERDNLLASISDTVVVIEAGVKSGTFYTVKKAFKESVPVLSVPGSIYSKTSVGCHNLIKTGFKGKTTGIYTGFEDILFNLGITSSISKSNSDTNELQGFELTIAENLHSGSKHIDDLCLELEINYAEILQELTKMELNGLIVNKNGYISLA